MGVRRKVKEKGDFYRGMRSNVFALEAALEVVHEITSRGTRISHSRLYTKQCSDTTVTKGRSKKLHHIHIKYEPEEVESKTHLFHHQYDVC
jgi:hypothetical protein